MERRLKEIDGSENVTSVWTETPPGGVGGKGDSVAREREHFCNFLIGGGLSEFIYVKYTYFD